MARYIDADKIHEFVTEKVAEGKDRWKNGVPYEWAYALTVIDNAPTANVAPIADTVRKMQERLKERAMPVTGGKGFEGVNRMATNLLIDQIAKEMLEGKI